MTAKEYLQDIQANAVQLRELKNFKEYTTGDNSRVNARIKSIENEIAGALNLIESLQDPIYRALLLMRYFNGYSINQTAERLQYSTRWAITLQGRAIAELERIAGAEIERHHSDRKGA